MRVIAGEFRSRPLVAPRGHSTRPTSDRLRETLFNILGPLDHSARFADLYAGSGAVGIEALSRGAAHCLLVEQDPAALAAIRKNLAALGLQATATVESRPVGRVLAGFNGLAFDFVFLDPPYETSHEYTGTLDLLAHRPELLASRAQVIAEHASRTTLPEAFGPLLRTRLLKQGDAALSFYAVSAG